MRTSTEQPTNTPVSMAEISVPPSASAVANGLQVFSAKLKNGKEVSIREMTGKDLVYIEEELSELSETRKSFHIIELLNVGFEHISYEEIESLGVRDIKAITSLISKANGDEEEEEEARNGAKKAPK